MKDKLKPFDVSILSSYMGKWLTAILAIFVIAVTISALESGHSERNIVGICVSTGDLGENSFEPLRAIIAGETRRAATVARCSGRPQTDWDLYVMATADFLRYEDEFELEALYEITSTEDIDRALIVSRPGDNPDLASLPAGDITFAGPGSVNGFLLQLSMLQSEGFEVPETTQGFRFEGDRGWGARIVLGVLHGASRLGACRQSDIGVLVERGVIKPDEIAVLRRDLALPENVIASHRSEAAYYRSKLRAVSEVIEEAGGARRPAPGGWSTAALLRSCGVTALRPIDPGRMNDARELHRRFAGLFRGAQD